LTGVAGPTIVGGTMRVAWLVVVILTVGCATRGAVRAALGSDLASLQRAIVDEQGRGDLDRGRALEIAQAVAEREIHSERGRAAAQRIRLLRSCSRPLLGPLGARAERADEGGAEAALILLAMGARKPDPYARRYVDAESGAWRAVAARASVAPASFTRRRAFFTDPDERVRRAALEAALEAPAPLDLEPLLEAARLDPDPLARSLAARAVGKLGGTQAARGLSDLWERADEDVRLTIVEAWSMPRSFQSGGREALLRAAESGQGVTAVAAAGALLRTDRLLAGAMTTLLLRAVADGSSDEQMLALLLVPLEARSLSVLEAASRDPDPTVAISALARLADDRGQRPEAVRELARRAKGNGASADAARIALAEAGEPSVEPLLAQALASSDRERRRAAGAALIALGSFSRAATLLGDADADVRTRTACSMLAVAER